MARIKLVEQNEATGAEKERYDELAGRNAVTNMKKGLLNDAATYDAYMAWYTSRKLLCATDASHCISALALMFVGSSISLSAFTSNALTAPSIR